MSYSMKTRFALVALLGICLVGNTAHGQTINWGSVMLSDLADSDGRTLDDTYTFELGAFVPDFMPSETNINDWVSHWRVFDRAEYNGIEHPVDDGYYGYFTGAVQMTEGGHSSSSYADVGLNFENLDAYVWIRNDPRPQPGTEWLLVRAPSWAFPIYDCCETNPLEWSVSNLTPGDVPLYGKQGGTLGPGVFTDATGHTLQTYTFIPEPSSAMLLSLTGSLMLLRRRRA